MSKPRESDWKHFKAIHPALRDRYFKRAIDEMVAIAKDKSTDAQDRFWDVHEKIEERQEEIKYGFGEFSRSQMQLQVTYLRRLKVLSDEELEGFSDELQDYIRDATER